MALHAGDFRPALWTPSGEREDRPPGKHNLIAAFVLLWWHSELLDGLIANHSALGFTLCLNGQCVIVKQLSPLERHSVACR